MPYPYTSPGNNLSEEDLEEIKDLLVDSIADDLTHQKVAYAATDLIRLEEHWRIDPREDTYYPLMAAHTYLNRLLHDRRREIREEMKELGAYLHERSGNPNNRTRPGFTNASGEIADTKRRREYLEKQHPSAVKAETGFKYGVDDPGDDEKE